MDLIARLKTTTPLCKNCALENSKNCQVTDAGITECINEKLTHLQNLKTMISALQAQSLSEE